MSDKITFNEIYEQFPGVNIPVINEISFDNQSFEGRWRCLISTYEARVGTGVSRTKPKAFLAALSNLITGDSLEIIEGPFDVDPPNRDKETPDTLVVYDVDGKKYEYKLNKELWADVELPFTTTASQAQKLGKKYFNEKLELQRERKSRWEGMIGNKGGE